MKLDYLIVGQGIAGTNLAFHLLEYTNKILVVDNPHPYSSTRAAAGLFNPITGRKLTKTWLADSFFPYLHQFYPAQEHKLQAQFFYKSPIYVPFDSIEKQNTWVSKSSDDVFLPYILTSPSNKYQGMLNQHFSGMELNQSGFIDTNTYLDASKEYFQQLNCWQQAKVEVSDLQIETDQIIWNGNTFKKVIFCDGSANAENPLFNWLDYRRVKGEILLVEFEQGKFDQIVNRGCWVIPLGNGTYKVGSTYDFRELDTLPTEKGKTQVQEKLEALTNLPYKILDHWAGVRPATYDRRPFIGLHPEYSAVGLFNGMGAKGISMTPYLAKHFCEFLEEGKPLMPEVILTRKKKK